MRCVGSAVRLPAGVAARALSAARCCAARVAPAPAPRGLAPALRFAGAQRPRLAPLRAKGKDHHKRSAAPVVEDSDEEEEARGPGSTEDDDDDDEAPDREESFEASVLREAARELRERAAASVIARAPRAPSSEWSAPMERALWSKIKKSLRPTQAALGYDWCFYKMQQFTSEDAAQRYMDSKPVPYVQRGSKKYIVDHHHTLAALELSGFDVDITLEQVRSFDKTEQTLEGFWGYMEGRGWAFLRDENYNRIPIAKLPKNFALSAFRNDVYRSMGGFARVFDVLKRGKELDDRLFFEFRWGYFFWIHRKDSFGLWPDKRLLRGFQRCVQLVSEIDLQEYSLDVTAERMSTANVNEIIFLCQQVIEPAYQMLSFYLRHLAVSYDDLPKGREREVPGLREIFGSENSQLPGKVIR